MIKVRLGDSLQVKHGFAFPGSGFGANCALPQVLTPGNFAQSERFKKNLKSFSGDIPPEYRLKAGDLVVTMTDLSKSTDTLGLSAIIPDDHEYLHNQRIGLVRFRSGALLAPTYFHYLTRTPAYRSHIVGTATGTTVRHTSPGRIEALELEVPDLQTQEAAGNVLSALDDKIVANVRMLEVEDRLLGAQARKVRLEASTTAVLGDLLKLNYGKALPSSTRQAGGVPVIGSGGHVGWHNDALIDGPCIVLGRKGTVGATYWIDGPSCPIDTTYWVEPVAAPLSYLFYLLKSINFAAMSVDSAVPGLNRSRAYVEPVPLPSPDTLISYERNARPVVEHMAATRDENVRLTTTRDELLPLLMSGKITVKDAEKTVEGVL